jgi:hypothetical protein
MGNSATGWTKMEIKQYINKKFGFSIKNINLNEWGENLSKNDVTYIIFTVKNIKYKYDCEKEIFEILDSNNMVTV